MASTNKTTHYELSQYIGTDKPTYLVDYNQDMSKIDTGIYDAQALANVNESSIGTLSNLTTTNKTNLVSAVNEVNSETSSIGDLSNLTTTAKTNLVSAINEVDSETAGIGTLANLTTTNKTNLVSAVNEVNANVGDLTSLTTTAKTSLVASNNEMDADIGDLSNLTTSSKGNLVSAINEVNAKTTFTYSKTEEVNTGRKWIDGKDIYSEVFEIQIPANTGRVTVPHGLVMSAVNNFWIDQAHSFLDFVGYSKGVDSYLNGSTWTFTEVNDTNIVMEMGSSIQSIQNKTLYITLNHTKAN